jgi:methyltransferase-like protein
LGENLTLQEQYLDFLRGRKFRQSLLCHQEVAVVRETPPSVLKPMYVAAPVRALPDEIAGAMQKFEGLPGSFVETDTRLAQAALRYLGAQWPAFVSFEDLLDAARERIDETASAEQDSQELAETLLQLYRVNFLEMHLRHPQFATTVSERPLASPIARFQVQSTPYVSTLAFGMIRLGDPVNQLLLSLMDGTRSRAGLLDSLRAFLAEGALVVKHDGEPITDPQQTEAALADRLDASLSTMAQQGLLLS